jgi:hypothetical protein
MEITGSIIPAKIDGTASLLMILKEILSDNLILDFS